MAKGTYALAPAVSKSPNAFAGTSAADNDVFVYTSHGWTSLQGKTGPQGPSGAQGAQGPTGPAGPTGLVESAVYRAANGPYATLGPAWTAIDPRSAGSVIDPAGFFTENSDFSVTVMNTGWYDISATAATNIAYDAGIHLGLGSTPGGTDFAGGESRGSTVAGAWASTSTALRLVAGTKVFISAWAQSSVGVQVKTFTIARLGGAQGPMGPVGGTEYAYWAAAGTGIVNNGAWKTLPIGSATTGNSIPVGAFTWNADGSVTIRDAGWYQVQASVYSVTGPSHVTISLLPDAMGVLAEAYDIQNGGVILNPVAAYYFVANQRVYITGSTAGGTNVREFSIHRVGAGGPGIQGPPGGASNQIPNAYSVAAGFTPDRAFNPVATNINELAAVLGTLINDMKANGLIVP